MTKVKSNLTNKEKFLEKVKSRTSKIESKKRRKMDEFGTEFTPFNIEDELEEGNIDESGFYIQKRKEERY